MTVRTASPASFRDRSGFVFFESGEPYRQINASYEPHYRVLVGSQLAKELQELGLLILHEEADVRLDEFPGAIAVIKPERVPFISYPYEWSFSQLKDAALCTLEVQKRALAKNMALKDASAYNIQFLRAQPVFIDTLSFELYQEGEPWIAYGQFCRHFLAPLALMSLVDTQLAPLLRAQIDGIPIDLASKLLPGKTKWNLGLQMHIHMHAKAQSGSVNMSLGSSSDSAHRAKAKRMSKTGLLGLIDSLEATINGLHWKPEGTVWADYYANTNYTNAAMSAKHQVVAQMLSSVSPRRVWDIGANTGEFSAIAAKDGAEVIAWDLDPAAVEKHYLDIKSKKQGNILPLIQDLSNPSPDSGWALRERDSFLRRANADVVLALALIHHLAIGNNVPFEEQARFFAGLAPNLVIEFVPKADSQVQRMLSSRKDVFDSYSQNEFEAAFNKYFRTVQKQPISESERTLYLMERLASQPS